MIGLWSVNNWKSCLWYLACGNIFSLSCLTREHECSSCRKHYDPINMFTIHKKIIIPKPKDGAICFWKSSAEFSCRFRMERSSRFEYQQHHLLCCHHHHHQQSSMLCSLLFLMEHTTVGWGGGEWGGSIIYIIPITKDTWTWTIWKPKEWGRQSYLWQNKGSSRLNWNQG